MALYRPMKSEDIISNHHVNAMFRCPVLFNTLKQDVSVVTKDVEHPSLVEQACKLIGLPINKKPIQLSADLPVHNVYDCTYTQVEFCYKQFISRPHIVYVKDKRISIVYVSTSFNIHRRSLNELAFINYVAQQLNFKLSEFLVFTINPHYTNSKDVFFKQHNVTRRVRSLTKQLDNKLENLLKGPAPNPVLGKYCFKPEPCKYFKHCWPDSDQWHILKTLHIPLADKLNLFKAGIITHQDIQSSSLELTDIQNKQLIADSSQNPQIDRERLNQLFTNLTPTFQVLDIEAAQFAIPLFNNQIPFDLIPFLFSVHRYNHDSQALHHFDSFFKPTHDFRRQFAETLLQTLDPQQSIVIYDQTLEKRVFKILSKLFPDLAEHFNSLIANIIDLAPLFNKHHIILPGMKGKSSMKSIISCIQSSVDFNQLEVQSGNDVVYVYKNLYFSPSESDIKLEASLKTYCEQDTKALLDLVLYLKTFI